jgi:hypothetical protein
VTGKTPQQGLKDFQTGGKAPETPTSPLRLVGGNTTTKASDLVMSSPSSSSSLSSNASKDTTTYQIGNKIMSREEFNQANDLIKMRTPTGSKQLSYVPPVVSEAVVQSNKLNPSPFQEQQVQRDIAAEEQGQIPISNEMPSQNVTSFETSIGDIVYKTNSFPNPLNYVPPTAISQSILAGELTPEAETLVQTAAQIIDAFTSALSARKSAQVTTAEGAMTDAIKAVNSDIENVSKGLGDANRARKNLINFEASINRLETRTKGLGKVNLRYWLGGGKEVEQEVLVNRQLLEDLKIKLIMAEKEGRLVKARQRY